MPARACEALGGCRRSAFSASAVQKETPPPQKKLLPVKGSCCFTSPPPLPPAGLGNGSAGGGVGGTVEPCPRQWDGSFQAVPAPHGCGSGGWREWSFPPSPAVSPAQQVAVLLNPCRRSCCSGDYFIAASCSSEEILIMLIGEAGEGRLSLSCAGKTEG